MINLDKRVYVAAPCGKTPVCDVFYDCFYGLQLPPDSSISRARLGTVPGNLNKIIECAKDFDYVFIVEDDSMFAPDTVIRLLQHNKDVVAGLCLSRQYPFKPYIYELAGTDDINFRPLKPEDEGLIKVAATGMGGILIKMSVFDKLKKPYFYTTFIEEVEWGQDILFAKSLVRAGIEVFCDTDVPIWHATQCAIGAIKNGNGWETVIRVNNQNNVVSQA